MKEIKAYIRSNRTDSVVDALATVPHLPGIAMVALKEVGHPARSDELATVDMVKLELDVGDDQVGVVIETLLQSARTGDGHPGDGKIYISEVPTAVDIATGESL
ncbi:P-II family nitrogen regulator [Salinisphaera orenii]|uniref:P-II family nitrogen regulator n=1 Tax=Salinisphaera orenii TaxID=856731 RepID=UPI000DBE6C17